MRKVFIDMDVIIDFLIKRDPFSTSSLKIFEYSARKELELNVSSLSISNLYYVIGRLETKEKAKEKVKILLQLVRVLPVGKSTIENAVLSNFKDFEDGIQHFCAKEAALDLIITRNFKDYAASDLSVQIPDDFLADFENKQ